MKSLKNGSWWDATVWDAGRVPIPTDDVYLEHDLTSNKKIRREALLYSRKGGIEFNGFSMDNFVGGGHSVPDSDVGLEVTGNGQLDLQGTYKTPWFTSTHGLPLNASVINISGLGFPIENWKIGDPIGITPNVPGAWECSESVIRNITATEIVIDPLPRSHAACHNPRSGKTYYPQIFNLAKRDVYIRGTANAWSHIFINAVKPQFVKNISLTFMGPRKDQVGNDGFAEFVKGRYALHFHHAGEGSRGSEISGNVAMDCKSHVFVPHGSNGILIKNNVTYRTLETPFWWDLYHPSNDITYEGNLVVDVFFVAHSKAMGAGDTVPLDQLPPTMSVNGFQMGMGKRLKCIKNCVAGMRIGDPKSGAAYFWEAADEDEEWNPFEDNIAHNCFNFLGVWQNTRQHHGVRRFLGYNSFSDMNDEGVPGVGLGIRNGSYANPYRYFDVEIFNAQVSAKAASQIYDNSPDGRGQIYDNCIFDTFYMPAGPLKGEVPILIRNSKIGQIIDNAGWNKQDDGTFATHNLDVVNTTGTISLGADAGASETIRVQNATETYQLTKAGKVTIPKFYFDTTTPPPPPPPPPPTVFKNAAFTKSFTRNNCGTGFTPSSVSVTVTDGQFTSTISQADADLQANVYGQNEANRLGTCTPVTTTFKNVAVSKTFTRNNCPAGTTPGTYTYTVAAGKYSASTQAAADLLATNDLNANGQNLANTNATCTTTSVVTVGMVDVPIVVRRLKITSTIAQRWEIRTTTGSLLRSGNLVVGDNLIDISNIAYSTFVVRVAGKNYTITK